MCTATQLQASVLMGFSDDPVNRLLDLDTGREVAFSLVTVGATNTHDIPPAPPLEPLHLETVPLSKYEVDYPVMREMHAASSLATSDQVRAWREQRTPSDAVDPRGPTIPLQPAPEEEISRDAIERVVLRRGSTRQFAREPISFAQLATMLDRSTRGFLADFHNPSGAELNYMYVLVNAVDGLQPGAYYFHRDRRELELLKEGDFRQRAGYLGLEQDLPADAAANVFFLADLNEILARYSWRQIVPGRLRATSWGQRPYLLRR
jgi:hypothetical protein